MNILALDLGVHMGVASGLPGDIPSSRTIILKKPKEPAAIAFSNLVAFLDGTFRADRPAKVFKEAALPLQAFRNLGNAAFTVRAALGFHAIVEAMCVRFGLECQDVPDRTVRRHFIGRANCGNRQATKAAIIQRCHLLGYMPRDAHDDNRADACALFDFASATFGKSRDKTLHLFGEADHAA
jgi:hypothetical protein